MSNLPDDKQMESFLKLHLNDDATDEICFETSQTILNTYFTGAKTIDNASYERDIFKIIKKILILKLQKLFAKDLDYTTHLALFFFKKYFKKIFSYLSELIMREVAYSNEGVINFLKYYSLDTLVVETTKYSVPQIKEENGPRWNVVSMLSVLKTYIKTEDQIELLNQKYLIVEKEAFTYFVDQYSPHEYNNIIESKFEDLSKKIEQNAFRINTIYDSLNILTDEDEIFKAKEELGIAEATRYELREEKAKLVKAKIKQFKIAEYEALIKQMDQITREKQPKLKIIEQNKDSYISIKNSLTKALISKKQAL